VLSGLLVASIWGLLAVAVIRVADARLANPRPVAADSPSRLRSLAAPAGSLGLALALAALAFALRPAGVLDYARAHTSFVAGAVGLAGLSLTLATGVMLTTLRR
jgi:hypothetical protein